ncbi:MAG: hypothetical protein IID31_04160 [Planctomycetes bacterium]|nr:hypothetical protein [Planctomycetota bacterium]
MLNARTTIRNARHLRRLCGRAAVLTTLTASVALTGCSGHGGYTQEFLAERQAKMAILKSATEWDFAHQRFLAGELDKALKHVSNSIAMNDNVAKSHILRGRVLMEQAVFDEAFVSFDQALVIDENNVEAMYYTGLCYERVSNKEQALHFYLMAADAEPSSAQYVVAAAEMLIDLDRITEAIEFIESRGDRFEHNAGVRQTLGQISLIQGEFEQALKYLSEARILAPDANGILEDLTRAQIATERFAEAEFNIVKLQRSVEGGETRRDLKHMRAKCLVEVDRLVEARQLLMELTGDDDGERDVQAWKELGHVAYMLGDGYRVKQAAARVIALSPNKPDGYMLRALWQRQDGNLQGAFESLTEAVALSDDANPRILRGIVAQQLGRSADARESFTAALEIDPGNEAVAQLLNRVNSTQFATVRDDDN